MIDKPLYENPLAGGNELQSQQTPNILKSLQPGLGGPAERISGPGFISDMRDRTLQDPYSIGGAGQLGLARNDGSYTGAMFLNDESRPRSEEDIRNRYEQARAQAAESRRKGFLGQVVLPGEQSFDQFKEFSGNSFFLKRNPNIPETAYSNYDLTDVGGFDIPEAVDPNNLLPGTTPPTGGTFNGMPLFPNTNIDDASMKGLPETNEPPMFATTNPYNRVGQQLTGLNENGSVLETLKNIEQGIASLGGNFGQGNNMNQSSNYGDFDNFGIGSFYPPYGGMYG
jgi:hypothetical protein